LKVVTNTSPLILLAKIERLDLLGQLYETVLVPSSVYDEIRIRSGRETEKAQTLIQSNVFHLRRATADMVNSLPVDLGRGERETIALAIETDAGLVVIDDQEGRRIARNRGLRVTGTIGILVEARERGLIASIRKELDHLVEAGLWLSEAFYHRILNEFDE
jgi:predicted nucleic acid-binding protein